MGRLRYRPIKSVLQANKQRPGAGTALRCQSVIISKQSRGTNARRPARTREGGNCNLSDILPYQNIAQGCFMVGTANKSRCVRGKWKNTWLSLIRRLRHQAINLVLQAGTELEGRLLRPRYHSSQTTAWHECQAAAQKGLGHGLKFCSQGLPLYRRKGQRIEWFEWRKFCVVKDRMSLL